MPGTELPRRSPGASGRKVTVPEPQPGAPSRTLRARAADGCEEYTRLSEVRGEEGTPLSRRPSWLYEGARVLDPARDREGIVQFIGEWENPQTRRLIPEAVFLRPEGGGVEWIVAEHRALRRVDPR